MVAKKRTAASSKKKASATGFISDLDCYLFGAGTHYDIYQKLGAHPKTYKGKEGIYFAVWAPHAKEVHLVGDFNNWNPEASPMERISESGIWEIFNPGMKLESSINSPLPPSPARFSTRQIPLPSARNTVRVQPLSQPISRAFPGLTALGSKRGPRQMYRSCP